MGLSLAIVAPVARTPPAIAQVPAPGDPARLVDRMIALHRARIGNDAAGWYALLSPDLRRIVTLAEFKADLGMAGVRPVKPPAGLDVTLERVCACRAMPETRDGVRCVAVLTVSTGPPPKPTVRWIEAWDLVGEEWYWIYGEPHAGSQPPAPPRCPGERQPPPASGTVRG